jgi:hypothetical protein
MTLASIDWNQIFELVWVAALAGVLVAVSFATIILGATRAADHRRADRHRAASGYFVVAALAAFVFAGGVVYGISVIASN